MGIQLGLGFGKGRRVITVWMPPVRGDVDYDDQPPNLAEEEDPRQPDRESIEHDRNERDIRRLEQELRGHAKPEKRRMAKAALRARPR